MTPREVGRLLRVGPDRVRSMIQRGELGAVNVAPVGSGKPRYVVLPSHLAAFEKQHAAAPVPTPARRRKRSQAVDYFPD
jgi:hypothetical protein